MHIQENSVETKSLVNQQVCCIIFRETSSGPIFGNEIEKKRFLDMLLDARRDIDVEIYAYCVLDESAYILAGAEQKNETVRIATDLKARFECHYQKSYPRDRVNLRCETRWIGDIPWESVGSACGMLHQLPVRAMRVERAEDYWWSSLKEYLLRHQSGIVRPEILLAGLDMDRRKALRKLRALQRMDGDCGNDPTNKNVLEMI